MTAETTSTLLVRQRLLGLFRFSPRARKTLTTGALLCGILLATIICLLAFSGDLPGETAREGFVSLTGGLLLLFTPLVVVFVLIAAFLEERSAPRALLWSLLAVFSGLAGLLLALLAAFDMGDAVPGLVFLLLVFGPLVLLLSLPAVYFGAKTAPAVRAVLQADLEARALALIQARGMLGFAELAGDAGIPAGQVEGLVDGLLASGRLAGMANRRRRLVFTSAYLDEKQRLMLDLIRASGRIRLAALAGELGITEDVLADWIYQAIQRGQFSGYINWREGLLYSLSAKKIGKASQCPNCGGQLAPGRGDSIQCLHCGSQVVMG